MRVRWLWKRTEGTEEVQRVLATSKQNRADLRRAVNQLREVVATLEWEASRAQGGNPNART